MLEIEVKYALRDPQAFAGRVAALGARPLESRTDADRYFNAPDRDFAATGEAFRIRRIGERNLITWKGPKLDHETKSREEIEIPFADGAESAEDLARLLERLGYRRVGEVIKRRQTFALPRDGFEVQLSIDDVDRVGTFAELEIIAGGADYERAKATVLALAAELGLDRMEPRSYLTMTLAAAAAPHGTGMGTG